MFYPAATPPGLTLSQHLSASAPMSHMSDSSAVLMLLQHTVYIYNLLAVPLWGTWMSCALRG